MALDCGIEVFSFWQYSVDEIVDLIESHRRVETMKLKQQLSNDYMQVVVLREYMATLISDKVKPKQIYDIYPTLFAEEKEVAEEQQRQQALELHKEQLRSFAERFNNNIKKGE